MTGITVTGEIVFGKLKVINGVNYLVRKLPMTGETHVAVVKYWKSSKNERYQMDHEYYESRKAYARELSRKTHADNLSRPEHHYAGTQSGLIIPEEERSCCICGKKFITVQKRKKACDECLDKEGGAFFARWWCARNPLQLDPEQFRHISLNRTQFQD